MQKRYHKSYECAHKNRSCKSVWHCLVYRTGNNEIDTCVHCRGQVYCGRLVLERVVCAFIFSKKKKASQFIPQYESFDVKFDLNRHRANNRVKKKQQQRQETKHDDEETKLNKQTNTLLERH